MCEYLILSAKKRQNNNNNKKMLVSLLLLAATTFRSAFGETCNMTVTDTFATAALDLVTSGGLAVDVEWVTDDSLADATVSMVAFFECDAPVLLTLVDGELQLGLLKADRATLLSPAALSKGVVCAMMASSARAIPLCMLAMGSDVLSAQPERVRLRISMRTDMVPTFVLDLLGAPSASVIELPAAYSGVVLCLPDVLFVLLSCVFVCVGVCHSACLF